ncbi:DUF2125 domain-containing protein [Palleronia abyssalis]|uniref:DUF2125 domain-containing protein n=1 Tax=Palleronia abyssalis TaxID=1501240 RepID=A0A2R8BWG8_9RHOB|nr:DUF2125 domain-containing protein [Palleronia abyssalis]SPJ24485.1 hypothetical protein PAA8504_02316 [Palleronia abyssalis]
MRLLTILVIILALGWTGYWFVGAQALESAIRSAINEAREGGIEVDTASLEVAGFPNRFDTMIEQPQVHFPSSGITWSAPFLQILALSYRPNQVIIALPDTQELTGPFGAAAIDTDRARASATFSPSPSLPLDHANLVVEDLLISSAGRDLSAKRLLAATRIPEGAEDGRVQNIGITLDDVKLPDTLARQLGGAATIDGANLNATLTLDRPIDRDTYQGGEVRIEAINIETLDIDWGDVGLDASGDLQVGADGYLAGELSVALNNWPRALELAATAGLIPQDQASQARQGLSLLSGLSGAGNRIEVPLSFRDGRIFMGPVPLGPAPRL